MAKDVTDLVNKLQRTGQAIGQTNQSALTQIGVWGKGEMVKGAVAAGLRPGGALPKHTGAKWGARFETGAAGQLMRRASALTNAMTIGGDVGTAGGVQATSSPTILLRYVGPVHWAFSGTRPHVILARAGMGRARRRRAFQGAAFLRALGQDPGTSGVGGLLRTPYGPRPYVNHPGTKGRNTWPATKARLLVGAPRMWRQAQVGAITNVFRRL
jgi:hypothetical protein